MKILLLLLFTFITTLGHTQNYLRFTDEVKAIQKKYDTLPLNTSKETIVFTGSSSIRLWRNLSEIFPDYNIINTGFGASVSEDLLFYTKELILNYKPKKVFIYEGDNDVAGEKKTNEIIDNLQEIIKLIKKENSNTKIILIAAKPSIKRWHLKKQYKKLNRKQKQIAKKDTTIYYADVWSIMLKNRMLKTELFSSDGLHMNAKGYKLWQQVIKKYINL